MMESTLIPGLTTKDVESINTLVEIAALLLTDNPDPKAEFSFDELLTEVQALGAGEVILDYKFVRRVTDNSTFLAKTSANKFRLKALDELEVK